MKKFPERVFSGMRPTGRLHIGHYFGALVNYLELQQKSDCLFMVADLHAMTSSDLGDHTIGENSKQLVIDWLSVGVDPGKAIIFVQSSVPEHAELATLLGMYTTVGWLERNPTYKEQRAQLGEKATGSLGFLSYPVLQTVDVCLYKATKVPIGEDQKPHLEMGRELIRRFNTTHKADVFPEFSALLTKTPKLPGLDGRKMSKSYGNAIELSESPESVRKRIKTMLTDPARVRRDDPGHPEICPVFAFHHLFTPAERVNEIEKECRAGTLGCFDDKMALADRVIAWQEPIRKRRAELEKDMGYVEEVVRKGNEKARAIARQTMEEVAKTIGFWPPRKMV
jgi:tryptophanyl-tRNA synthetase